MVSTPHEVPFLVLAFVVRGETVNAHDLEAVREKRVCKSAPDEAGYPGNKYSHKLETTP